MARNRRAFRIDALVGAHGRYLHRRFLVPIALLPTLVLPCGARAEIFKWVDDTGKVHYGDAPPPEQEVETIRPPPPPSDAAVMQSRNRLEGMRERAAEWDKEREQEKQAAAREVAMRKQLCSQAQGQLRSLQFRGLLFRLDEQGNRIYLEDDERALMLERARKAVRENCR